PLQLGCRDDPLAQNAPGIAVNPNHGGCLAIVRRSIINEYVQILPDGLLDFLRCRSGRFTATVGAGEYLGTGQAPYRLPNASMGREAESQGFLVVGALAGSVW